MSGGEINVIYVVAVNYWTVSARVDSINADPINAADKYTITSDDEVEVWNGNNVASFSLTRESGVFNNKYYTVKYFDGTNVFTTTGTVETVGGKEVITFSFEVNANTSIDIMSVYNGTDPLPTA